MQIRHAFSLRGLVHRLGFVDLSDRDVNSIVWVSLQLLYVRQGGVSNPNPIPKTAVKELLTLNIVYLAEVYLDGERDHDGSN